MSLLFAAAIGVLVFVAVLQLLQRDAVRIAVGLYMAWNALNVLLLAVAKVRGARAPILDGAAPMSDPVVQAFLLTAIVVTFGFTAFLVTLVLWLAHRGSSIDISRFDQGQG